MRTRKSRGTRIGVSALEVATLTWESLDCPRSLTCAIMARYGEWRQLVQLTIDPNQYISPWAFFRAYQATKLLSKYPYLDTGIDRKVVAREKFADAEFQCFLTNQRFLTFSESARAFDGTGSVTHVLFRARQKIALILGEPPAWEDLDFRFGPGASFGVRGDTSVYKKLTSPLECTFAFARCLSDFLGEFPGWVNGPQPVNLVAGSELTFVPKDAKTDRPICIEPLLNGLMQKGYGSYIRDRLLRYGVNLRDQSINQRLARKGVDSDLATVDFSSASDTIAYMLILELLPIDWVEALDVARSPYYLDGEWRPFEKWSSMGNAYTFELESLIFYAIACASCEVAGVAYETGETLHVYGDDVIIPRAAFDLFLRSTEYCGFSINTEKSYHSGSFRESCGADWFEGQDVRPFLLKRRVKTPSDVYYVANSILKIAGKIEALADTLVALRAPFSHAPSGAQPCGWVLSDLRDVGAMRRCTRGLGRLHARLVAAVPKYYRFLVSPSLGDVGFHADFDVAVPRRDRQCDGWWCRGLIPVATRVRRSEWPGSYALYLAGLTTPAGWWDVVQESDNSSGYSVRTPSLKYRRGNLFVFGDWGRLPTRWSARAVELSR